MPPAEALEFVSPIPPNRPNPPLKDPKLGPPTRIHQYKTPEGATSWVQLRWDLPNGEKEFRPLSLWRMPDGTLVWKRRFPPSPRALYNLPDAKSRPTALVLIVEGEKTVDAVAPLFPGLAVLTCGGSNSAGSVDWSPVKGRHVVIWPDADTPGQHFAVEVRNRVLAAGALSCAAVPLPPGLPDKWDLADPWPTSWDPTTVESMVMKAHNEAPPKEPKSPPVGTPRQLAVLTWEDFKDRVVPAVQWIWEPYLPQVPFGILASVPKHGKSILALQIAVAVATGLPLFGLPTNGPAGVGVLALEDDKNVIHRRIAAIVESYGTAWTPEHDQLLSGNLRILVRGRVELEALPIESQGYRLAELAQELGEVVRSTTAPPALLFLDTLNSIHEGDENSATESRPLIATVFALNASLGCSVYALHHLRKAGIGKFAPPLEARMDPELIRGSGALVAGARATCQLGWIQPKEAAKAGLDHTNSQRRYAIFGLTAVNDGPCSPWVLLEHSEHAGIWVPAVDGDRILATLKGGEAMQELCKAKEILVDVASGMKHHALAEKHYPGDPKAMVRLKYQLSVLRRRHGWLQRGSLELTVQGFRQVMDMGLHREDPVDPDGAEFVEFGPSSRG